MNPLTHLRYEVLRTVRNRTFVVVSLALPLVLYVAVTPGNRHARTDGVSFPLYFMTGMASYGALFAVFSPGARIALDRARGWTRQLRITPLSTRRYFAAKVLTAYLLALPGIGLVYLAGTAFGVRMTAAQWLEMTGLILVGLVPFIIMALVVGHVVRADALQGAVGGLVVLFALFGGAYGELFTGGAMVTIMKLLPSYWIVHAGREVVHGGGWPAEGWIVVAVWSAAMVALVVPAYRRDTRRA